MKLSHKNNQTHTEDLPDTQVRQKYLGNPWFVAPLILPASCLFFSAVMQFMFWLMYDANIEQRLIDLLDPYFSVISLFGALSSFVIIIAVIPLAITSIVLSVVKRISLGEMFISIASYFFVFFFAVIVIAAKA